MSILYVYCDCFTLRLTKFCYRILLLLTTMRPSPRSHASNVVEGETAVDRGWRRQFECYWNLLMLDFWYRTVPHARTLPKVMHSVRMPSTVDGVWSHANACEAVSENAALILDCWPLHTAERFGTVYRIVSYRIAIFCTVSYRIHRFPPRQYHVITKQQLVMLTSSLQLTAVASCHRQINNGR